MSELSTKISNLKEMMLDITDEIMKRFKLKWKRSDSSRAASSKLVFQTKNTDTYLISPKTDKKDLSKYYIISTKLPLKNFNGAIQQIIKNAILK